MTIGAGIALAGLFIALALVIGFVLLAAARVHAANVAGGAAVIDKALGRAVQRVAQRRGTTWAGAGTEAVARN